MIQFHQKIEAGIALSQAITLPVDEYTISIAFEKGDGDKTKMSRTSLIVINNKDEDVTRELFGQDELTTIDVEKLIDVILVLKSL